MQGIFFDHGRRLLFFLLAQVMAVAAAATLPDTIATLKPAVVAIGTYQPGRSPAIRFFATGFAVGDGLSVVTNAHAVAPVLDTEHREILGIVTAQAQGQPLFRAAQLAATDREHDLALLRLAGEPLPALQLGPSARVREGETMAFMGFPLGMVMGLHHVTHQATISAITPVVLPAANSRQLDPAALAQISRGAFEMFQLDGTAYPGNSGSPLFDPQTGVVYGVINMVLLKGLKENALSNPSGISYAVPSTYVSALLLQSPGKK